MISVSCKGAVNCGLCCPHCVVTGPLSQGGREENDVVMEAVDDHSKFRTVTDQHTDSLDSRAGVCLTKQD